MLINLLILELQRQDGIRKKSCSKLVQLVTVYKVFKRILQNKLHTKGMRWKDLTGPEKLWLFEKINVPEIFPTVP